MKVWRWVLAALLLLALWFLREALATLLALLLLSATIAYIVSPLARLFERKLSKKWGAPIAFAVVLCAFAGWLIAFVPMMVRQAVSVGEALPGLLKRGEELLASVQGKLADIGIPPVVTDSIEQQLGQIGVALLDGMRAQVMKITAWLGSIAWIALAPVVSFYLLRDRKMVFSFIERLLPSRARPLIASIATASRDSVGQYVRGQVIVSLITGTMTAAGLLIAGLPSWLLMGFLMAIFNLIPYFGPLLGAIPILLLATAQGFGMILKCLIVIFAAQQLESLFVTPRVLSNAADLHPVVVVIALFIGGSIGGLAGMVFVIPAVLILRVILSQIIENRVRSREQT